jgi:hypothetical protein
MTPTTGDVELAFVLDTPSPSHVSSQRGCSASRAASSPRQRIDWQPSPTRDPRISITSRCCCPRPPTRVARIALSSSGSWPRITHHRWGAGVRQHRNRQAMRGRRHGYCRVARHRNRRRPRGRPARAPAMARDHRGVARLECPTLHEPRSGSLHGDRARDVSAARLASPVVPDRVARIGSKTNGQCVKHEQGGDNGDEDEKRFHHWLLQVPVEPS